jgi:hypothetical protein
MIVLAVVNTEGGTGKTTTVAFASHVLHEQGRELPPTRLAPAHGKIRQLAGNLTRVT